MYLNVIRSCDGSICVRVRQDSLEDDSCYSCVQAVQVSGVTTVLIVVFRVCSCPELQPF